MNQFCPRCGAFFAPEINMEFSTTQVLCTECGLTLEDPPQILAPSKVDDDQVACELVEWPPYGIAVGNAHDRVKAVARWVCPPAADEGVAQVLEALLDSKP